MGIIEWLREHKYKNATIDMVRDLLRQKDCAIFFDLNPTATAKRMVDVVWELNPEIYTSGTALRPSKITFAAAALTYGIKLFQYRKNYQIACLLALGYILGEIKGHDEFYELNNADKTLLNYATRNYLEVIKEYIDGNVNEREYEHIYNIQLAAGQGLKSAQLELGKVLIAEGKVEEGRELLQIGADINDAEAQNNLGLLYESEGNINKAQQYYKDAASNGHSDALFNLGNIFLNKNSMFAAKDHFIQSAKKQNPKAINALGLISIKENDLEQARTYFTIAANMGFAPAQYELAQILYYEGRVSKAIKMYDKAANQGYAKAQYSLGVIFHNHGKETEAIRLYQLAAYQGLEQAQLALERLDD